MRFCYGEGVMGMRRVVRVGGAERVGSVKGERGVCKSGS